MYQCHITIISKIYFQPKLTRIENFPISLASFPKFACQSFVASWNEIRKQSWSWLQGAQLIYQGRREELGPTAVGKRQETAECYSCSSLNPGEIVGGSGVDPGIFLSYIALTSIPQTLRCRDPYDPASAMRAGVGKTRCDDGLCVKINYIDKSNSEDLAILSCCGGPLHICFFQDRTDVLRACLPQSRDVFKEDCVPFTSRVAYGSWCTCGRDSCNSASRFHSNFVIFAIVFALLLVRFI